MVFHEAAVPGPRAAVAAHSSRRRALTATLILAGLASACTSQTQDLPMRPSPPYNPGIPGIPPNTGGRLGNSGTGGATGGGGGGTGGGAGVDSGGAPSGAGGLAATCEVRYPMPYTVCIECKDSAGRPVRKDCHSSAPISPATSCIEERRADASICLVCRDLDAQVVILSCRATTPACASPPPTDAGRPPATDAGAAAACKEVVDAGARCSVCVDDKGDVTRTCTSTDASAPVPISQITCVESSYADGSKCTVCKDEQGNVVKQGCFTPGAPPAP